MSGPPENHKKNIGFLSNSGSDPLKSQKALKPAFNVGPSSVRQRTPFKWCFTGRPYGWPAYIGIWLFPLFLYQLKNLVRV